MGSRDSIPALVKKAQGGDRAAFEKLFSEHREPLERFVHHRLGPRLRSQTEAEDVLQETFLRACQSIQRFRWRNEGSFGRWLCSIAEHVILKLANREERRRKLYLELAAAPAREDATPSRALRRDERLERLQAALGGLSPDHREVIMLARIEGLRIKEIAKKMERSPNAVLLLLSRALKKLRDSFGDTESFHLPAERLDRKRSQNGAR